MDVRIVHKVHFVGPVTVSTEQRKSAFVPGLVLTVTRANAKTATSSDSKRGKVLNFPKREGWEAAALMAA